MIGLIEICYIYMRWFQMPNSLSHRNPLLTVDIIIETPSGIVLIRRNNPPFGWALPGGFVDYGEALETAAIREAKEETGLDIGRPEQFHAYSAPNRDPRHHSVTMVFIASAAGTPCAGDDAGAASVFTQTDLPENLAFDHARILSDYFRYKRGEKKFKCFY